MTDNTLVISRIGYGAQFNDLIINNDCIEKKSKNIYGNFKITKEIKFFKFIINNKISLPIPEIYEFGSNSYKMKYLTDYIPLYKYFILYSDNYTIIKKIQEELNKLHSTTIIKVNKEVYTKLVISEVYTKIITRYSEITDIVEKYSFIKKVNGVELLSFKTIMDTIYSKTLEYIESIEENSYILSVIHGDCQFNNILYNVENDTFVFIDPRGYFGDLDLYGPPEYDYAKIQFALSGYDVFDNMEITTLNIEDNNLILPKISLTDNIFTSIIFTDNCDITRIFTLSIWLSNAHCFKNNISKTIFSFYYALYLSTLNL